MIIAGSILLVLGIVSASYGIIANNDVELKLESFFDNGKLNPGDLFLFLGIALAVIGLVLLVLGIVFKSRRKTKQAEPLVSSMDCSPAPAPKSESAPAIETECWYCSQCGTKNDVDGNFCTECATRKS